MIDQALVLAAGKSTRIADVSGGRPKPLLPIGGKPVIVRALEWLHDSGTRDIWVNLHYRPNDIRSELGDGRRHDVILNYSYEPEILGTAGAFRRLTNEWRGPTVVVYGDNLVQFNLSALESAHRRSGALATVALFDPQVNANSRIAGGRVSVDEQGYVTAFVEGAAGDAKACYVNAGVYILEPQTVDLIPEGFQDFARDIFPGMVRDRRLSGYVIEPEGYCIGLDTPESYRVAEELVNANAVSLT